MTRCEVRLARLVGLGSLVASCWAADIAAQAPRAVPRQLRLADAIAIALEGSTQLDARQAQLESVEKARRSALFALGPDLAVSATRAASTRRDFDLRFDIPSRYGSLTTLEGDTLSTVVQESTVVRDFEEESSFRQYEVTTSVRLFDGFANVARLLAANEDVRSEEHGVQYTRKQVQETVIAAYYNLLRAQLLLRVAEEAERVAREQLDRTQALYELGSAARSDVLKSQVQLGDTRLTSVRARHGVRQARVDLEHAMNLERSADYSIDTTLADVQFAPPSFEGERDYALAHREDLLAQRAGQSAASRRVWAARGGLWPSVDFRYSLNTTRSTSQFRFGASSNRNRQWAVFANWNLWDRYQTYAGVAQARANARIAELNLRQAELDAIREIRRLVNASEEASERYTVSRENVDRAREDLRLAQEKFRVGAGTILDVIEAESDLTSTQANVVQAVVDYLIGRANLARATGRPFTEL